MLGEEHTLSLLIILRRLQLVFRPQGWYELGGHPPVVGFRMTVEVAMSKEEQKRIDRFRKIGHQHYDCNNLADAHYF